jgi:hypothetical protein
MDLLQSIVITPAFYPEAITSAGTTYNGNTTPGIDTSDYDYAIIELSAGTIAGDGAVTVSINSCATDVVGSSAGISGAAFSAVNSSSDLAVYTGRVSVKDHGRYIWVKAVKAGTGSTAYGVNVILFKKNQVPAAAASTTHRVFEV